MYTKDTKETEVKNMNKDYKGEVKMTVIKLTHQNFEQEVMNSDVPVLIDFWAAWCGPCKMIGPVIEEIATDAKGFKVGKINVDEEPSLAEKFGIISIPTLIVIKDGKIHNQAVGVKQKQSILDMIE